MTTHLRNIKFIDTGINVIYSNDNTTEEKYNIIYDKQGNLYIDGNDITYVNDVFFVDSIIDLIKSLNSEPFVNVNSMIKYRYNISLKLKLLLNMFKVFKKYDKSTIINKPSSTQLNLALKLKEFMEALYKIDSEATKDLELSH